MMMKPFLGRQLRIGHPLARGLVGCWLFNEGVGNKVFDLSGNGNHGTLQGNVSWVPAKFGAGTDYPGAAGDYILLDSQISMTANSSVAFWFNADDLGSYRNFLGKYDDNYNVVSMHSNDDTIRYIPNTASNIDFTVPTVLVGNWYFLVLTVDAAGYARLYLNSVESSTPAQDVSGGLPWYINAFGRAYSTGAYNFYGIIDHVMIFNRALTASEIARLYRQPFCMFERMPIELWAAATQGGGAPPTMSMPLLMQQMNHFGGGVAA